MINLKEILYDYAYTKGGGLPLTPQEVCNAVVQWVQKYLKDEKYVMELSNQDNLVSITEVESENGGINYNINIDISNLGEKVILKPVSVTEESVPVVGSSGLVHYTPVSELGGASIYKHDITINSTYGIVYFNFYSSSDEIINSFYKLKNLDVQSYRF